MSLQSLVIAGRCLERHMSLPPPDDVTVVDHENPGWRIVAWEGEVDAASAPAMLARTLLAARGSSGVVVDLGPVRFMGAAGLQALARAVSLLRATGSDLQVRNPSLIVSRMLALVGLRDVIEPASPESPADGAEHAGSVAVGRLSTG